MKPKKNGMTDDRSPFLMAKNYERTLCVVNRFCEAIKQQAGEKITKKELFEPDTDRGRAKGLF